MPTLFQQLGMITLPFPMELIHSELATFSVTFPNLIKSPLATPITRLIHSTHRYNFLTTHGKICLMSVCPPNSKPYAGERELPVVVPLTSSQHTEPLVIPGACRSPALRSTPFLGNYLISWACFPSSCTFYPIACESLQL